MEHIATVPLRFGFVAFGIFAITAYPYVFTSNIFAIMGMRALYFMLAAVAQRFRLLRYGLAPVLMFIGASTAASLAVTRRCAP